jgi:hypothetical protein
VKTCHICERRVDHDHDPYYVDTDPRHYADERFEVAMGNHLFVRACWSCWFKWPDRHKRRCGELTIPEREDFAELLRETAP